MASLLLGVARAKTPPLSYSKMRAASSGGASKLSKALIITQVALSLVLLLGAGLFVRSFQRLRSIDLGFQEDENP